jgi:cysteine desulfurase
MSDQLIYLDHSATTPTDPAVVEAMLPYFSQIAGNPSSIHQVGRAALQAIDDARYSIGELLNAPAKEIVFTSGGSESDNLAIKGVALEQSRRGKGKHIITSSFEHHAVLDTVEYLKEFGFEISYLPVSSDGFVSPDDLRAALRPDTILVSIMYANNEIGTIQPISELGAICREHGVPFHTDAVQAAGALEIDIKALNVDLLSLASHKIYGPKGVGALYVRRGTPLLPQINGGAQERRRRAGTENIAGIVGFASALRLAEERRASYVAHTSALRDRLIDGILARIPHSAVNGSREYRLPNNANIGFAHVEGESILMLLDQHGICASSGSACSSGSLDPSHVLLALGCSADWANGSVRFTLGKDSTVEQIDRVIELLPAMIERLRAVSPSYQEFAAS